MKHIMTMTAAMACAFVLTACGGGGSSSDNTLSRADEGIWSNLNTTATPNSAYEGMQAVILSDGTYWGIYGQVQNNLGNIAICLGTVLQGTTSVSGSSASGTYTDFQVNANGTYSGTVSAQNTLNLTVNDPMNGLVAGDSFNMNYDSIYNQPASLSTIVGNYLDQVDNGCLSVPPPSSESNTDISLNLTISDSRLTLDDQNGNVIMTGTVTPHGTTVNVFDVSLTTAVTITAYSLLGLSSIVDRPINQTYD